MSFYNFSLAGNRKYEVPQILFPSSHGSEFRTSNSTRPPIVQNLSSNSANSALSASTTATSVSASSIAESIEEAMSTALFGSGGSTKSPNLSITSLPLTSTHPTPWNDDELLNNIKETLPATLPPRPIQPRTTIKHNPKKPIVKFSLGSNPWETDSEDDTPAKRAPAKKRDERSRNQREKEGGKKDNRRNKTKIEEIEETSAELDIQTERLMNIRFKKGAAGQGTGCGLGIEGLKGMQNIQGPHHKGEYFKRMREVGK